MAINRAEVETLNMADSFGGKFIDVSLYPNVKYVLFPSDMSAKVKTGDEPYVIADLQHLEYLQARGYIFKELRNLPNLRSIRAGDVPISIEIVNCPNLQRIDMSYTTMTTIPPFSNLLSLYMMDSSLLEIPYLPLLVDLNISRTKVKIIPYLPELVHIQCDDSEVESIPFLPKLVDLFARNCKKLKEIHRYPRLFRLNVQGTSVECIPPFPHLAVLYTGDTKIKYLPHYGGVAVLSSPADLKILDIFSLLKELVHSTGGTWKRQYYNWDTELHLVYDESDEPTPIRT